MRAEGSFQVGGMAAGRTGGPSWRDGRSGESVEYGDACTSTWTLNTSTHYTYGWPPADAQ